MEANEKACREALLEIHDLIGQYLRGELVVESLCMRIKNKINYALAKSARNCEVGTPEEQSQRFDAFCVSHYAPPNKDGVLPDGCDCPCYVRGKGCNAFVWGQLPYVEKEGGAK